MKHVADGVFVRNPDRWSIRCRPAARGSSRSISPRSETRLLGAAAGRNLLHSTVMLKSMFAMHVAFGVSMVWNTCDDQLPLSMNW